MPNENTRRYAGCFLRISNKIENGYACNPDSSSDMNRYG